MPDTWVTPRVWAAFERVSASKMNEISTALAVLFPYAAGGDIAYRDPAGAYLTALSKPAGLGLLQNSAAGILSYLTGGSALQVLRKNAGNDGFEWAAAQGLHTIGNVVFAPGGQNFTGMDGTYANITGASLNLTLSVTCTVVVFAVVVGYNPSSGNSFVVRSTINGVADASAAFPFNGGQARNEALPYIHYATGVTAGTRAVVLQCQNSSTTNTVERGRMIALAFAE